MTQFKFIIKGNQEKPDGNPIPYHRATQGSFWNPANRRYHAWKDYVRREFGSQVFGNKSVKVTSHNADDVFRMTGRIMKNESPIVIPKGSEARMDIWIWWANGAHADADNVFKGIADALFENDKDLTAGSFESMVAPDKKGRVDVIIKIEP
jgi:ribosomal protein S9